MGILSLICVLVSSLVVPLGSAQPPNPPDGHWVDTWTATPQLARVADLPPAPFVRTSLHRATYLTESFAQSAPTVTFHNTTLRQTLHLSLGASTIRLRLTNVFGSTNLPITAVTVALPVNGSTGVSGIQLGTLQNVTFSGSSSFSVPNGALIVSDPISLDVDPQSAISVSVYLESGQQGVNVTAHPLSMTTSFFVNGNAIWDMDLADAESIDHWYVLLVSSIRVTSLIMHA